MQSTLLYKLEETNGAAGPGVRSPWSATAQATTVLIGEEGKGFEVIAHILWRLSQGIRMAHLRFPRSYNNIQYMQRTIGKIFLVVQYKKTRLGLVSML